MGLLRRDARRYEPGTKRAPYKAPDGSGGAVARRPAKPLAKTVLAYTSSPTQLAADDTATNATSHPQGELVAFRLHLDAKPTLTPPSAPAPDPPDPGPEWVRIEQGLGIPALAANLAEHGTPPMAPPAERCDSYALEQKLIEEALDGTSRWKLSERISLRRAAREQAELQAQAENEQHAVARRALQDDLDARWAELGALRERAEQHLQEWIDEETRRRETEQLERQAALDAEWQGLIRAEPRPVTAALRAGIPDSTATVCGYLDGVAVVAVSCPTTAVFKGTGAERARSIKHGNDLYLAAIASRVLAGVGRALTVTPAVNAVICIAVRTCEEGDLPWEALYVGSFSRSYVERLVADGRWSADPDLLVNVLEDAEDVELDVADRTREVCPLDLTDDAGLKAVMYEMDPIRSGQNAASGSDEEAVQIFLDGAIEHDDSTRVDEPGGLERRPDAPIETPNGSASPPYESTQTRTEDDRAASQDAVGQGIDGDPLTDDFEGAKAPEAAGHPDDPLRAALKDRDAFVRRAAVEAISRRQEPSDIALLLEALRDADDNVRLEAMYALKDRLPPDARRDALIKACADSDEVLRRKAIGALAELADGRDTPLLLEALRDPDGGVRLEAIYAVKHRLAPEMRDALLDACGDVDENVRRKALEAIVELDDERDIPVLLKALKDSDSSVRLEAIYALGRRSTPGSSSGLSALLSEAMRDEDARARQAAVALFGRLEQPTTGHQDGFAAESDPPA